MKTPLDTEPDLQLSVCGVEETVDAGGFLSMMGSSR
jgi:hypothetical protein